VCIVEFTGHLLSDRDTTSYTGMGAGVNGNNQWEWEGMGLKKKFPLISAARETVIKQPNFIAIRIPPTAQRSTVRPLLLVLASATVSSCVRLSETASVI